MMSRIAIFLISLCLIGATETAAANNPEPVIKKVAAIAKKYQVTVGVSATHIESKQKLSYHGDTPFFMASTMKFPIAVTLLKRVDNKEDSLTRKVYFDQKNSVPGSGNLYNELNRHPGTHCVSLQQLLKLMMVISDNTATDLILREVKGPKKVTSEMQGLGFTHISVDRSISTIYLASSGLPPTHLNLYNACSLNKAICQVDPNKKVTAWKLFQGDRRDTTTPDEMVALLSKVYAGRVLSSHSTDILFNIMSQCQTGNSRIKGMLPPCTKVAHKTGTWTICAADKFAHFAGAKQLYRYANDIGVITLPASKGHVAIAVYVKSKAINNTQREQAIALISREIYNYFLQAA